MNIFVKSAVRIRPFITTDQPNDMVCVSALPHLNQIVLSGHNCFTVDYALPVNYTQDQVFEVSVQPMVNCILQGYDISVVVFGQTNSGKTYTLFGPGLHCAYSEADYGIIPRATREIFNQLMQGDKRYKVRVTFIEILGETIRDLLGTSQLTPVLEEKNGMTSVCNVNEIECHSVSEVFNWLHIGMSNRQLPDQTLNARSSYSHSVFTLFLEQEWFSDGVQHHVHSQAQFTDLAGSNSVFVDIPLETPGMQKLHYDNGLMALQNMIVALSDLRTEHAAVYYMNTVLTKILKNSYGGTANTLLICCVSPLSLDIRETLHSLQLAVQARSVKNFLAMNVHNTATFYTDSSVKAAAEDTVKAPEKVATDVFGLSFAASQWLKLVASAENLFAVLATNITLPADVKDQIEHWLCLKQECEECIESDRGLSDSVSEGRLLYRIDELTEPEDRNTSTDGPQSTSSECGSSCAMCDSMLDSNTGCPDFSEKLDGCLKIFKDQTDCSVKVIEENFVFENGSLQESDMNGNSLQKKTLRDSQDIKEGEADQQEPETDTDSDSCPEMPPKNLLARRNSICEGANAPHTVVPDLQLDEVSELPKIEEDGGEAPTAAAGPVEESSVKPVVTKSQLPDLLNLLKHLKLFTAEGNGKQTKLQHVIAKLEVSLKEIEDLKKCILTKEQIVGNMIKHEFKQSLKQCQQNSNKIVSEYMKNKSQGSCIENAISCVSADGSKSLENPGQDDGEPTKSSQLCKKCFTEAKVLEVRSVGAVKNIMDCGTSTSNYQMTELKMQLEKELKLKQELEKEIASDKDKIKELEEKYEKQEEQIAENNRLDQLQWIKDEEVRLMNIQKSVLHLQEEMLKKQSYLEKREAFLKEKHFQDKGKSKDDLDISDRVSHLTHVVGEKSDAVEITSERNEKEALRLEIENLRKTRQLLIDQLCSLDEKFQTDKVLTTIDERKLLECDEAVEAIDTVIEYKNQLMCGAKEHELMGVDERGEEEDLLLARLMKLSPVEIRSLLCRYFKKVIDLRESGRRMEVQLAELDMQADAQTWKIHALSTALQQAHMETQRQIITLQKEHDEEMHLILRRLSDGSDSESEPESAMHHYSRDVITSLNRYKHENKNLRKRVQEMEAVIHVNSHVGEESMCPSPITIPRRNLRRLQGMQTPCTTKVTRQKNKLIIQQQTKKPGYKQ